MTKETINAFNELRDALKADESYAWSWHCNLAMPIMDGLLVTREEANWQAAALMLHIFGIDVTRNANWMFGMSPPPKNPKAEKREDIAASIAVRKEVEIIGERIAASMQNELHSTPEADTPESLGRRLMYLENELGKWRAEYLKRFGALGYMP